VKNQISEGKKIRVRKFRLEEGEEGILKSG